MPRVYQIFFGLSTPILVVFFRQHFTVLMAARADLILCLFHRQILPAAIGDVQNSSGERLFTLNGGIKLAHGFVSFGVVDHHAPSLQSISAFVNPLEQIFFEIFSVANRVPNISGMVRASKNDVSR